MTDRLKPKPYRATSLNAAEREVRMLRKQRVETHALLETFARDRLHFAMLASRTPLFDNPLVVMDAEKRRDQLLREKGLIK